MTGKRVGPPRRKWFSFSEYAPKFTAEDSAEDLAQALWELLQQVGADLGADDLSDDAFVDHAGDQMSDAGVPDDMIDRALDWCRRGGRGDIEDTR